jgi:hypothetical protein
VIDHVPGRNIPPPAAFFAKNGTELLTGTNRFSPVCSDFNGLDSYTGD